jgi:hypothetical protein
MTRTLTALSALALCAACSEEIETYDPGADLFEEWTQYDEALQQAVPTNLTLEVESDGTTLVGWVSGAEPDVRVWIITGEYGEGACPNPLRGACLSVRNPKPLSVVHSSPNGEALFSIPARPATFHKPLQAVVIREGRAAVTELAWVTTSH